MHTIDDITWNNLSHAYGEDATDVANYLRTLFTTNSSKIFEAALSQIDFVVCHQGTIYPVTSYVVPFLIKLLPNSSGVNRVCLVRLLTKIANGQSYNAQHQSILSYQDSQTYQEELKEQLLWVKNCQMEVWKGFKLYLTLLGDQEDAVRIEVPYLLATLLNQGESRRPEPFQHTDLDEMVSTLIITRLPIESNSIVVCSFLFALSFIGVRYTSNLEQLQEILDSTNEERVRICAAMCLIDHRRHHLAVDVLTDALSRWHEIDQLFNGELPWFTGWLRFQIIIRLCSLSPDYIHQIVPALLIGIDAASHYTVNSDIEQILAFTFQGKKIDPKKGVSSLTSLQRTVLQRIYENQKIWNPNSGNVSLVFRAIGLENNRQQWGEFLVA